MTTKLVMNGSVENTVLGVTAETLCLRYSGTQSPQSSSVGSMVRMVVRKEKRMY